VCSPAIIVLASSEPLFTVSRANGTAEAAFMVVFNAKPMTGDSGVARYRPAFDEAG
jgi:hypothetical protein